MLLQALGYGEGHSTQHCEDCSLLKAIKDGSRETATIYRGAQSWTVYLRVPFCFQSISISGKNKDGIKHSCFSFHLAPNPALCFWKGKKERKYLCGYFSTNFPWKKACNIKWGRSILCKMLIIHNQRSFYLTLQGQKQCKDFKRFSNML